MKINVSKGDLFAVPLNANSFGAGVVAGKWNEELYLILFKERFAEPDAIRNVDIRDLSPLLASSSLDAKIWHGQWPMVCHGVDTSVFVQPIYKVEEPEGLVAESFDRDFRQMIDDNLASYLNYRKGVAPVRLENALKSYHGLGEWNLVFDELLYENIEKSNEVFNKR